MEGRKPARFPTSVFPDLLGRGFVIVVAVALPLAFLSPAAYAGTSKATPPGSGSSGPDSRLKWIARGDVRTRYDSAAAMVVSPDGSTVFVAGTTQGRQSRQSDYVTWAYDSRTGARRWVARYNDAAARYDRAAAIAVSPDGSVVFVTGFEGNTFGYGTVAYDAATGAQLWAAHDIPAAGFVDFATAVAVTPDGGTVLVTGNHQDTNGGFEGTLTLAYLTSDGSALWGATLSTGFDTSEVTALAVAPAGSQVFVSATVTPNDGPDSVETVAYRVTDGRANWVAGYNSGSGDFEAGLAIAPDGSRLFLLADSYPFAVVVAYDPTAGTQDWTASGEFSPAAIAVAPDSSRVYAVGSAGGYATMAIDAATGIRQWAHRFRGPGGSDTAASVVAAPDGTSVFVTGSSAGIGSGLDFLTVAYVAGTGASIWKARLDDSSGADDSAVAIAVAPDSSAVFVTGQFLHPGTRLDVRTAAYRAEVGVRS